MKVLITDGNYKHTLAAVRSLGRKKIKVVVGSHNKYSLSFFSKYCSRTLIYPDPYKHKKQFLNFILKEIQTNKYDVLMPVGALTTKILAQNKEKLLPYVKAALPDPEAMKIAINKSKTMMFAQSIGIPMPQTIFLNENDDLDLISSTIQYPVVIKGPEGAGSDFVAYANSPAELKANVAKIHQKSNSIPIIQEYIDGDGYGFFALMDRGTPKAIFMHQRIKEFPITGGPSVVAKSFYSEHLKSLGLKILSELKWNGVAMVEFRRNRTDGEFKLMEINPKFWGSLELAIASGVDFPYLLCEMLTNGNLQNRFHYNTSVTFCWIFPGSIMHLLARPSSLKDYYHIFQKNNLITDLDFSDAKPLIFQVSSTFYYLLKALKKGNFRHPQGKPIPSNHPK